MQSKLGEGVIITGTLPRDAESRYTAKGTLVVEFGAKVGERGEGDNKQAIWANCVAFGKVAEFAQGLQKGDIVLVIGKTKVEEYTKNGEEKKVTKLICEFISVMGGVAPAHKSVPVVPPEIAYSAPFGGFVPIDDDDDLPF